MATTRAQARAVRASGGRSGAQVVLRWLRPADRHPRPAAGAAPSCPPRNPADPPPPRRYPRGRAHADVHPLPAHAARRPGRRGGGQPPAARAGGLHPSCRAGRVLVAAARLPGAAQGRAGRPRGDGADRRAGGPLPRAGPARALRGDGPLGRVRRQRVPAAGPQAPGLPARPHARGDVHAPGEGPVLQLQGPAPVAVPDPDQVPRRGPAPRRAAARARVRHEGLLLLRRRRRRSRAELPAAPRRVPAPVLPARPRGRRGGRRVRGDGRLGQRGVPAPEPLGRGHLRPLHRLRLRGQRGGRDHPRARRRGAGRPVGRARGGHPRHPDHPDPRRPRAGDLPARGPRRGGPRTP